MFMRKGSKRKASSSWKGGKKGGFKKRRGFGPSSGSVALTNPFGPSSVQYGAGKGITDQAVLYKTIGSPGRLMMKFRTSYSGSLQSASGAFTSGGIAIPNSLFDPAGAQGSIKAGGWTSWFGTSPTSADGIYYSYMVTAAKLKVYFNAATANTIPVNVGLRFLPGSGQVAASASDFMTSNFAKQNCVGLPAGGQGQRVISIYASIAQVMSDVMASVAYDDTFSALSNATPTSQVNADYFVQSTDASTTTNILYRAELTQWVCLFGRKTLAS